MACAPCAAAAAALAANGQQTPQKVAKMSVSIGCPLDKTVLETWYAILKCVQRTNSASKVGLTNIAINQLLGVIQSGLNYPDNYCYYYEQLEYFQSLLLPLIITNVSECLE